MPAPRWHSACSSPSGCECLCLGPGAVASGYVLHSVAAHALLMSNHGYFNWFLTQINIMTHWVSISLGPSAPSVSDLAVISTRSSFFLFFFTSHFLNSRWKSINLTRQMFLSSVFSFFFISFRSSCLVLFSWPHTFCLLSGILQGMRTLTPVTSWRACSRT